MKILIIIAILILLTVVYNLILHKKTLKRKKVCFRKLFTLTSHPLLKVFIDKKEYIFLVDSGANINFIDENITKELKCSYQIASNKSSIVTGGGEIQGSKEIKIDFLIEHINHQTFNEKLTLMDLSGLQEITHGQNLKISGVIGAKFLNKHRWNIDFKELVFWV